MCSMLDVCADTNDGVRLEGPAVICPSTTAKEAFAAGVKAGSMIYHAFPFNPEYASYNVLSMQ